MERISLITLAVVLSAGMALAYGGMGRGMMGGGGYGMGPGAGMGMGPGMGGQGFNPNCPRFGGQQGAAAVQPLTKDESKKKVDEYIAKNLKGYKIDKVEEFKTPRATMYNYIVKDATGNTFYLRVNPWGNVMGPFLAQQ